MNEQTFTTHVSLIAIGLTLAACTAPPTDPSSEHVIGKAPSREVDAAPSAKTVPVKSTPDVPVSSPSPGTGIECGNQRCTTQRPFCCQPPIFDPPDPKPKPYCITDLFGCGGAAIACRHAGDCAEGQHCVHDATVNANYCDDDISDGFIMCRDDSECKVLGCGPGGAVCEHGKCDCR